MSEDKLVAAVLRTVDERDAAAFSEYLAPDVEFRFGNAPPLYGAQEVRAAVDQFLGGIRAIRHDVADAWRLADVVVAHGSVTYTRHGGDPLSVPFALVWYLRAERIRGYHIFVDISAL